MLIRWTVSETLGVDADGNVISAIWRCAALEGDEIASVPGETKFDPLPVEGLTQDAVVKAIHTSLGDEVAYFEAMVRDELQTKLSAPQATVIQAPWA